MTRKILIPLVLLFLFCLAGLPVQAAEEPPAFLAEEYVVGPGDVLDISIWKDETLSRLLTVLPDGTISFPLIGQVVAGGKSLAQLKQELTRKIEPFVPDPVLSVIVHQVNSMLVYVVGKVNNPGRFGLNTRINVLQALTMAGGLNPYAKKDKIRIFREENGETRIFPFEYDQVAEGNQLSQNIHLRRGDVVVVP